MNYKVVKIYVLKTRSDRLVQPVEPETKGHSGLGKRLKTGQQLVKICQKLVKIENQRQIGFCLLSSFKTMVKIHCGCDFFKKNMGIMVVILEQHTKRHRVLGIWLLVKKTISSQNYYRNKHCFWRVG